MIQNVPFPSISSALRHSKIAHHLFSYRDSKGKSSGFIMSHGTRSVGSNVRKYTTQTTKATTAISLKNLGSSNNSPIRSAAPSGSTLSRMGLGISMPSSKSSSSSSSSSSVSAATASCSDSESPNMAAALAAAASFSFCFLSCFFVSFLTGWATSSSSDSDSPSAEGSGSAPPSSSSSDSDSSSSMAAAALAAAASFSFCRLSCFLVNFFSGWGASSSSSSESLP
mmetsp:Transcript_3492/g.8040  ORF Transcript_3492/g.8040 Transcript_3492/m.8040 type:complete len:225 (-) Transcript_3492:68-742(-)